MLRCAILCSGPSLTDHDLSKIDCATIGTNLSYLSRQSDIQVFTHGRLIEKYGSRLGAETPDARWRLCSGSEELAGCVSPKVIAKYNTVSRRGRKLLPLLPSDYNVFTYGWIFCAAAPCALQVAISFGFDEIIFCGLDLRTEEGSHFYPDDEAIYGTRHLDTPDEGGGTANIGFQVQMSFFQLFKPQLDGRKVRIFNTTLDSAEHVFEKRPFESFWP